MRAVVATTTGFHLRRLAVELSTRGHDIQYFSYTPRFRMRSEGLDPGWAHSLFRELLPHSALALMRGAPWQRGFVESMLTRTDEAVARHLPTSDVFVGLSSMAVRSAAGARETGASVVIERGSRHVLSQARLISQGGGRSLTRAYIDRELASYDQADFIAVPSSHAAQSFLHEGFSNERLFVCPLGVDLQQFLPTPRPPGRLRLLFVGGWSYQKGVDVLVRAVAQRPHWELTHVGTHAGADFPRAHPRITSIGHMNHAQLARIMGEHHILVLPSRQDGFGMVLLEALASGLPVVASRMTGAPDIQQTIDSPHWVEIVEPGDVDDLLRGLDSMALRESTPGVSGNRHRLSDRDKDFYSWRGYGRRYLEFLHRVHAQRRRRP